MFDMSVVFDKVVGLDRAGEEEPWVAARPKGFWLMQSRHAPSEERRGLR